MGISGSAFNKEGIGMILEFMDGSQIEVLSIHGGPRLILGAMRDTLNIELSPEKYSFDELRNHFKDNPKTAFLYTYTEKNIYADPPVEPVRIDLGEGYKIFVSILNETKEIPKEPGKLEPPQFQEVFVVTMAQITYAEHLVETVSAPN